MKLAKSLLLGSAAALVAGTAVQAADLPNKKAAPVEYVRVCDAQGAGYFYIPGSDTCLKLSGFARFDYRVVSPNKISQQTPTGVAGAASLTTTQRRAVNETGFLARGRFEADARTETAYGTLRTFIRYEISSYSGTENSTTGGSATSAVIDKAFVQFAGIAAGRLQSAFDFADGADPYGFEGVETTDASTQQLSYTATFAGGFSATVGIEDPTARRTSIGSSFNTFGNTVGAGYGGERAPDVVGNVYVKQGWGSAQLSGAWHQINATTATAGKDGDGFAVHAAALINLPFLAAGDQFELEGGYGKGAFSYVNSNGINSGFGGYVSNGGADAVAIAGPGGTFTLAKEESYSVSGGILHYFTPTVNNIVFGGWEHVSYGKGANGLTYFNGGIGNTEDYRIADQINWFPVKGLQIGVEIMYIKVDQKVVGVLPAGIDKNPDGFVGHLRIERDF